MGNILGDVTLRIGASSASCATITSIKEISWKRMPEDAITPQTVMNSLLPVAWYQLHRWIEGEVQCLSEENAAFASYISPTSKNTVIPYMVAWVLTSTGSTIATSFTTAIPLGPAEVYRDNEGAIFTYRFKAYSCSTVAP